MRKIYSSELSRKKQIEKMKIKNIFKKLGLISKKKVEKNDWRNWKSTETCLKNEEKY